MAGGQSKSPSLVYVTCGDKCSLFLVGAGVVDFCSNLRLPPKWAEDREGDFAGGRRENPSCLCVGVSFWRVLEI